MVDRRAVGLKILVGVISFDLVVIKLGIDASAHVRNRSELAWIVRLVASTSFLVVAGMLFQLETRSRRGRALYWAAELRAEAIRRGHDPSVVATADETFAESIKNSWATTWPLAGLLGLTVAMWLLAGILR
jgi:hypothetical protein